MIPYLHFCTYFMQKKHLFLALICCNLFCVKLFSPSEHVFLWILVTNLRVLCFDIYAIPTMCTPYYQSRLNLVPEICLSGMRCHCYILVGIIYWVLTYVCRHSQLKIKAEATVDCGSIVCCDIGARRHRHGWFTSDVRGLSDELLLKVTNNSPERTLR